MKKNLVWVLLVMLVLSLATGCGSELANNNGSETTKSSGTEKSSETTKSGETSKAEESVKPKDPVKLTYKTLAWIKSEQEVTKQVIDDWNKQNPLIQVEYVQGDWGTIDQEMLTGFETGDVPDMFHYQATTIMTWKNRGFLADLKPMLDADMKNDVLPEVWEMFTSKDEKIVALPYQFETDVMFYNKKMFADKGIQVPDADNAWTLDELITQAKKLNDPEKGIYGLVLAGMGNAIEVINDTWATKIGYSLVQEVNGKPVVKVNDPRYLDLMKKFNDMIYVDKLMPADVLGAKFDPKAGFLDGKYAIVAGYGCWMRALLIGEAEGKNIDWGMLPPIKIDTTSTYGQIQTISVPEMSKNKEATMEFLKYFWNTENQTKIAKSAFIFPGRMSSVNSKDFSVSEHGWDMAQAGAKTLVIPMHVLTPGYGEFFNGSGLTIYQEYFTNQITLEKFIEKSEKEGTKALEEALK